MNSVKNKVLLINSIADKAKLLIDLFDELVAKNFRFYLLSSQTCLIKQFQDKNWPAKKIALGPTVKNKLSQALFISCSPWLFLKILLILLNYRLKEKITAIICLGWTEKILATMPAKLLGLKIIWLEEPSFNYQELKFKRLYKLNSRLATVIVFNSYTRIQLENTGCSKTVITLVQPAIKTSAYQDNLYNKLAQAEQKNSRRKYFTIGTITDLNQRQKIETLFQAVKICQTVIPNLQLIIVGDGEERKNLSWLAKKIEIDTLVWFVGEQQQTKKWLNSFDLYLVTSESPNLTDYYNILEAMATGLPVIGPRHLGLEDIISENKTGSLVENGNQEMLARQVVKIEQDKKLRQQLGKNGQERLKQLFIFDKMVNEIASILKINCY